MFISRIVQVIRFDFLKWIARNINSCPISPITPSTANKEATLTFVDEAYISKLRTK